MDEPKETYQLDQYKNLSEEIHSPLNKTNRIKYTCYDATANYIVCGATSGSLYLFQHEPCKFLQLIPNIYGPISHVSISPQERYIAYCTQKGTVLVYVIDLSTAQPIVVQTFHREMSITQLKWRQNECQFFVGDTSGNVYQVNLNIFLGRNLSNITIHPILFLESPIIQLCVFEQLLLVSNSSKCILCNTETEEFKQVGNQPRDGKFGACFLYDDEYRDNYGQSIRIVCARPGARIWECCSDGNVLQTHKFKLILRTRKCTNIRGCHGSDAVEHNDGSVQNHQISNHLVNLQPINGFLVIANTSNAFYIFDLFRSDVILWNDTFNAIHSIKVVGRDTILVFTKDASVHQCRLLQLDRMFYELIKAERFANGSQLLLDNLDYFNEKIDGLPFRYYYQILYNHLRQEQVHEQTLNDLKTTLDRALSEKFGENFRNECFNGISLRPTNESKEVDHKVVMSENEPSPSRPERETIHPVDDIDDAPYDEEIIAPTNKATRSVECKILTEDEKIVQNLFFIYKSLRISNFNLSDRYAEVFDQYDLVGIIKLLTALEKMILEHDTTVSTDEAKQHCAQMYLNYMKLDDELEFIDDDKRDFLIECFSRSNHDMNRGVYRCAECKFPLIIEFAPLKHQLLADQIVRYFMQQELHDDLWNLIEKVPCVLNLTLRILVEKHTDTSFNVFPDNLQIIVDMLISCANPIQFEHVVREYQSLQTSSFFRKILAKLNRLLLDRNIQCIRCHTDGLIDAHHLGQRTMLFSHDFVLNVCADHLDGLCALEICADACKRIPGDSISKTFYLKCLLSERNST